MKFIVLYWIWFTYTILLMFYVMFGLLRNVYFTWSKFGWFILGTLWGIGLGYAIGKGT